MTFLQEVESLLDGFTFSKTTSEGELLFHSDAAHVFMPVSCEKLLAVNRSDYFLGWKKKFQQQELNLIFLWEDRWHVQKEMMKERIRTLLGTFEKVHARETSVHEISKEEQEQFLNENHLNVFTPLPIRYGLYRNGELLAMASFSRPRKWKKEKGDYLSLELVRYTCKKGLIVSGGLSKLLKQAEEQWQPHDIMTYIDLDWSDGRGFRKIGFEAVSETGGIEFFLNADTNERVHASRYRAEQHSAWKKVYSCGSCKMVKKLRSL